MSALTGPRAAKRSGACSVAGWAARLRVGNHDARAADLVQIGRTGRGTPILLEPAGGPGGPAHRLRPGRAPRVRRLHRRAQGDLAGCGRLRDHRPQPQPQTCSPTPPRGPGVLAGNPIHEEMLEAARLRRPATSSSTSPSTASSGPSPSRPATWKRRTSSSSPSCATTSGLPMPARRPSVIVTGPGRPLDINLYQAIKALVGHRAPAGRRPRNGRRRRWSSFSPGAGTAPARTRCSSRSSGPARRRDPDVAAGCGAAGPLHLRGGPRSARARLHHREGRGLLRGSRDAQVFAGHRLLPRRARRQAPRARLGTGRGRGFRAGARPGTARPPNGRAGRRSAPAALRSSSSSRVRNGRCSSRAATVVHDPSGRSAPRTAAARSRSPSCQAGSRPHGDWDRRQREGFRYRARHRSGCPPKTPGIEL